MAIEIWKEIPEHPNYEVSNTGKVRNTGYVKVVTNKKGKTFFKYIKPKELSLSVDNGYIKCHLGWVHRLVCEAFHGKAPEGKEDVNHLDENRFNNNADNLEWISHADNLRYGTRTEKATYSRKLTYLKKRLMSMEEFSPGITDKVMSFIV